MVKAQLSWSMLALPCRWYGRGLIRAEFVRTSQGVSLLQTTMTVFVFACPGGRRIHGPEYIRGAALAILFSESGCGDDLHAESMNNHRALDLERCGRSLICIQKSPQATPFFSLLAACSRGHAAPCQSCFRPLVDRGIVINSIVLLVLFSPLQQRRTTRTLFL